jgi:hypothetical protein
MTQAQRTWWSKPGSRTVQQLVTQLDRLTSQRRSAGATTDTYAVKCCHLANPNDDNCYSKCMSKGGGYWIEYWWCCSGGWRYQCQECTTGPDCGTGPFYCSCAAGGWIC